MSGEINYGIDASSANKVKRTGVENYSRYLIETMKIHPLAEGERVVLYTNTKLDQTLGTLPHGWEARVLNWLSKRGWMPIRMSWEMWRCPPNVFFVPGQSLPLVCPSHTVTTIHDLAFARRPDVYERPAIRRLRCATARAVRKASKILVPSQATKRDLVDLYHVAEDRIVVTALAVDTGVYHRYTRDETFDVLRKHRLGVNFFLTLGRLEKKKNVANLIRAFDLFKRARGIGDPFELVLVGEPGYGYGEIKNMIQQSPHASQIRELGYLEDDEVARLMSQAMAFLFPSWYEGFGIPNLEAMAAGTAVVASDIPAHREVVNDAGILLPPHEPGAWTHAMELIAQDSRLRDDLVARGAQQCARYSWQQTSERTWEVFRQFVR